MNKKIFLGLALGLFFLGSARAHTLILTVYANGDDTITIEGKYDTGAHAAGALVRLEALNSGGILYEQRLPQESEVTVAIPGEPYQIVLDGGPGHMSVKKGIPPEKGFSVEETPRQKAKLSARPKANAPLMICLALAFGLLLLTLLVSIYNTNRILAALSDTAGTECKDAGGQSGHQG